MNTIKSLELFTGAGGLALGLQQAGCDHTYLIERDKYSCDNIRSNVDAKVKLVQDWKVLETDVKLVNYRELDSGVELVAGGPPCQPFSLGGKHRAFMDSRDMFPEAVRAVSELQPKVFVFENVKGLLRKSFATYFSYIILQLTYPEATRKKTETWMDHLSRLERHHTSSSESSLRYNVVFRLLNAADYGVPQLRHRVFIVGFRSDLGISWSFPNPTHSFDNLLYSQWVSGEYWDQHKVPKKRRPELSPRIASRVERLASEYSLGIPDQCRWLTTRDAIHDLPDPKNRKLASRIRNHELRDGARAYSGHTGSLLDEPSKTIKAGAHGVPGGENMVRLDDGSIRYFTVRESARIQTFPDEYFFFNSWTESMRQIGNAVPVRLAEVVGHSVVSHLMA
jgi:DNA (cytosine-5)-methyltransferase 1